MKNASIICLMAVIGAAPAAFAQSTTNSGTTSTAPSRPAVIDVPQPIQPWQKDAQNAPNLDGTSTVTDPAKVAELQARFAHGQQLEQQGKLAEALVVFDGIIADAPGAMGSLREAGIVSYQMGDLARAEAYFEKLHKLVPDYPMALEALIQVDQALKRDVKVMILIKEFRALAAAGKVPQPYFIRERIDLNQGDQLVISEFFDYKQEPYTVWSCEVVDANGTRKRWFLFNYEPDATKELQAKDANMAQAKAEVFNLYEYELKDDKPVQIDVYKNYVGLPDYGKMRLDLLGIIATGAKPIYSAAVPPSGQ